MDKRGSYEAFLNALATAPHSWSDVDGLIAFYQGLSLEQKRDFTMKTPPHARFSLLNAYCMRLKREFPSADEVERAAIAQALGHYICLDDFEYDDRESVVRITGLMAAVEGLRQHFREVWDRLKPEAPEATRLRIDGLIAMDYI